MNKQLYELFTEEGGNFLDADARGMALMAQTDLIDAISEFAAMPRSADAAGSLEARFDLVDDSGNPTALFESYKAEFKKSNSAVRTLLNISCVDVFSQCLPFRIHVLNLRLKHKIKKQKF